MTEPPFNAGTPPPPPPSARPAGFPPYAPGPYPGAPIYAAPAGPAPGVVYVGFWLRFAGYLLDGLILFAITTAIALPLVYIPFFQYLQGHPFVSGQPFTIPSDLRDRLAAIGLFGAAVSALYYGGLVARFGRTLGQRVIGARVVRAEDGGSLPAGRAFLRAGIWWGPPLLGLIPFVGSLASLVSAIGLLAVAWDSRKQGWHDKIARSLVVKGGQTLAGGRPATIRRDPP